MTYSDLPQKPIRSNHSPLESLLLKLTNNTKLERIIIFENIVVKQNMQ